MIEFQKVSIHYGTQDVISDVDLRINAGERVGIVGPNGAGKSTLFQMILGTRLPDAGRVLIEGEPTIGHVRQHPEPAHARETLLEYSMRGVPRLHDLEAELHRLAAESAATDSETERARLLRALGERQTEFEHLGGYELESRVKAALGGLGFATDSFDRPFGAFSGGWRMRAELARILAAAPNLLLLDEPSNYLDLPAVEWLQRFLRGFDGTLLLISHDRYLLRSLTRLTIEVDAGSVTRYAGDLDYYLREREVRYATLLAAKANQDRRREQLERFVERFKSQANKATQAQSRVKMIERMEEIRLPKRSQSAGKLRLAPAPHCGAEVMRLENADFSYDGQHNVLSGVDLRINRGDRVAIVGYNGMGKTTLLRLLAGVREPTAGVRVPGHKVIVGYQSQEFAETIPPELTVLGCAKRAAPARLERDLRAQLGTFGFTAEDVEKPAGVLSGGERIRLAFLQLFLAPPNFLLLDEPTTHLDLEGRQTLEQALNAFDGTLCLVSHDVEFVRAIATSVIEITPAGLRRYPGTYDEYRDWLTHQARQQSDNATAAIVASGAAANSSRELRRVRAQARARAQTLLGPLKRRVEKAEQKIAELEGEERTLSATLSSGTAGVDYAAAGSRLRAIQHELHKTALEWERDATELERQQQELAAEQAQGGATP
ncbi:MAG: ABC-F family ATP-binding cassette domain-containing protein [Kiritimatiellae bacterium]|nr:ABC-F family ATP-binding cassette domain-containing protein [Kiritimatiellia bacterium]